MLTDGIIKAIPKSLPVRGAWIEMLMMLKNNQKNQVAPRAGSVD